MNKMKRDYHDNGMIRFESDFIDGVPHGLQRHWHPNGVLAMEMPFDHGIIDGMVRQWNHKGELVATSNLKMGTGVLRTLNLEQGLDGEITYVDGKFTGRQRCYCGGELMATVFWLDNDKVSRKRYLEACKQNPNLPRYEDEPAIAAKNPAKKAAKRASQSYQPADELPLKLLHGSHVREALGWLQESRNPSRSLGEARNQDDSIKLVEKLYQLGAQAVHATEIKSSPSRDQNSGRLILELPEQQEKRKKLFRICGKIAKAGGFDADPDVRQRYLLLMLD